MAFSGDYGISPVICNDLATHGNARDTHCVDLERTKPKCVLKLLAMGEEYVSGLTLKRCEQVVPPAGWAPPSAIDSQQFRFRTRIQSVNELQHTVDQAAASESFNRDYHGWLRSQGKPVKRPPQLAGEELDLAKLHRIVTRRGGYDRVCENRLWKEVARIMQVSSRPDGRGAWTARSHAPRIAATYL